MKTMSLIKFGLGHVDSVETDTPVPGPTEVLVKVLACGVCRTDLHVVDGELPNLRFLLCQVMRSLAEWRRSVPTSPRWCQARASAFRGLVGPAASVTSVYRVGRISA